MNKVFLMFFLLYSSLCLSQTESSIKQEIENGNLQEALSQTKEFLSQEIESVKAKNDKYRSKGKTTKIKPELGKGSTYALLGKIYTMIALDSNTSYTSDEIKEFNPVKEALESFNMVKEVEKENSYPYIEVFGPSILGDVPTRDKLYIDLFNKGLEFYKKMI